MYEFYEFCRPMIPTARRTRFDPIHNSTKAARTGGREKSDLPAVGSAPDTSGGSSLAESQSLWPQRAERPALSYQNVASEACPHSLQIIQGTDNMQ